eukprot:TRINITY_DN5694_c0_g1_i13.p1 TRINITY_DN5694_c0_g1~~TRINITY_DN5694_c0_g1_i13.p1  ORF type:complete len:414 (-),score=35.57 TRINITY_DN5694_c0_g1_i13:6-1247(-)
MDDFCRGIVHNIIESVLESHDHTLEWGVLPPKLRRQLHQVDPSLVLHSVVLHDENGGQSAMIQFKALKQAKNDSCGYYAMYNALSCVQALRAYSDADASHHISQLYSRARFWRLFTHLTNHLKENVKTLQYDTYPWTNTHVEKGVLERPYIEHLMEDPSTLANIWRRAGCGHTQDGMDTVSHMISAMPDFSMHSLRYNRLPLNDIAALDKVFSLFSASDDYTHAFLLGQTIHWVCIVCSKLSGRVEVALIDSRNHKLLGATEEEIKSIMDEDADDPDLTTRYKGPGYQSLKDPVQTTTLFHDCITGRQDITTYLLEYNMDGFFESFEEHVGLPSKEDEILMLLIGWLEGYWPPPVIRHNIVQIVEQKRRYLSNNTRDKFHAWGTYLSERIDFQGCGFPVVTGLEPVIQWAIKL